MTLFKNKNTASSIFSNVSGLNTSSILKRTLLLVLAVCLVAAPALAAGKKAGRKAEKKKTSTAEKQDAEAAAETKDAKKEINFSDMKVVAVRPVIAGKNSPSWTRIGYAISAEGGDVKQTATDAARVFDEAEKAHANAFEGVSTPEDIMMLKFGIMFSSLALALETTEKFEEKKQIFQNSLQAFREMLKPTAGSKLSADTRELAAKMVESMAQLGEYKVEYPLALMGQATDEITKDNARIHGYLSAGLWLGLTLLTVAHGQSSEDLAVMGVAFALMFNEDAIFGGSDKNIAAQLVSVSKEIAAEKPSEENIIQALSAILAITPDVAAQG